jgi:hypothetical protein
MMIRLKTCYATALIYVIALTAASIHQAQAQLVVQVKMSKESYLINESVNATIYITNNAGRQLVLRNENGRPWLDFNITSSGRGIPRVQPASHGPVVIASGKTVAREVSLSASYALGSMGSFVCQAYVNMPGQGRTGFISNRARFNVAGGRVLWSQRIGVPEAPDEIRQYELVTFSGNRGGIELFAHVTSANRGQEIATIPLGKIITFRKPTGALDGVNNLHTLYQVGPDLFGHSCITPGGKRLSTTYYKRGKSSNLRLMKFANGEVRVAGGIPYDPVAEAEQRRKVRGVSERPPFVYK